VVIYRKTFCFCILKLLVAAGIESGKCEYHAAMPRIIPKQFNFGCINTSRNVVYLSVRHNTGNNTLVALQTFMLFRLMRSIESLYFNGKHRKIQIFCDYVFFLDW